ncbi:MAG: hypothetical protein RIE24_04995 [Silicimonas sp.]
METELPITEDMPSEALEQHLLIQVHPRLKQAGTQPKLMSKQGMASLGTRRCGDRKGARSER